MRFHRPSLLLLAALLIGATTLHAQQSPAGMSREQVMAQIQASGLSQEEIKKRAAAMGYDASEVDAFFAAQQTSSTAPAQSASATDRALQAIAAALRSNAPSTDRSIVSLDSTVLVADSFPIFGRDVFRRGATQFEPLVNGPVDQEYPLGPGDEVVIMLTGEVERSYTAPVSREGLLVVPQLGAVPAAGMTLAQLEAALVPRFDRLYSGVGRSNNSAIRLQVLLGRLRTNLVYIVGAAERPGAYQVSSVATVFNALYQAGGPAHNGSFRQIQVRRGGKIIQTVDLYRYLVDGDSRQDVRLQQGDLIHIPTIEQQVRLSGAVRRPGIYEILPQEGMIDLVTFAGGVAPEAAAKATVERVLPPEQRRSGVNRVVLDINLVAALSNQHVLLQGGDRVHIDSLPAERRQIVTVAGAVRQPGDYQWSADLDLGTLLQRASGLSDDAYALRVHVYRFDPVDRSRRLIRAQVATDAAGRASSSLRLADRDSVVVYSREQLRITHTVRIDGYVKSAGEYALAEGMSLKDLILAAGGFTDGADLRTAEVARLNRVQDRSDTTTHILPVRISPADAIAVDDRGVPQWTTEAAEFTLEHGDRVVIRRAPGYEPHRSVFLSGEVPSPGHYVLRGREDRLVDVIQRAGGLAPEARANGFQLIRKGRLLPTDLERALQQPTSRFNVMLEEGDSLVVPKYEGTVLVTGAVAFESRVLYVPGKGMDYYLARSGGMLEEADSKRATVTHQNGERNTIDEFLFLRLKPKPTPGSVIHVPRKPEGKQTDWDKIITRATGVISTLATLWLAAR